MFTKFKSILTSIALIASPVAAIALPQAAHAQQADRRILVINNSGRKIWTIRATSSDNSSWGEYDLLGDKVLNPGQSIVLWVSDGSGDCIMDLKAQTQSGQTTWVKSRYNVCQQDRWILNP